MAKRVARETNTPLVVALVFFVLTTITFGVLWYMQFSDQQTKDDTVKKAQQEATAAKGEAADNATKARVYRTIMGIPEEKDIETLKAETKGQEKIGAEIKKINEAMAKAVGVEDTSKLPPELRIWGVDDKGNPTDPPTKGIIPVVGDAMAKRMAAEAKATTALTDYTAAIQAIKTAVAEYEKMKTEFAQISAALPKDFDKKLNEQIKKFEDRTQKYTDDSAKAQKDLAEISDAKAAVERDREKLRRQVEDQIKDIFTYTQQLQQKQDTFVYDEPQGKIMRRLPEGIVEIDLGSDALVRPGLTFTVLPHDFPEKGRQSRIRVIRMPDERGEYKPVERFVEKATIEVVEVLGPKLSRARITSEFEPIRDAAGPGDLLYNSVWRKGSADHIALIGIFDVNGDGIDDIESVVRDLIRMGIPVDAYYDMRKREWMGQITHQTRYLVRGNYPVQAANDPNRDEKTALLGAMDKAVSSAQTKGGRSSTCATSSRGWVIASRSTSRMTRSTRRRPHT